MTKGRLANAWASRRNSLSLRQSLARSAELLVLCPLLACSNSMGDGDVLNVGAGGGGNSSAGAASGRGGGSSTPVSTGGMQGVVLFGGANSGGAGSTPGGAGGGGGGKTITQDCAMVTAKATDTKTVQPADIIVAIDTSGSMNEEIQFTQMQMNSFSQQIIASGIDVHVIMLAGANALGGVALPGGGGGNSICIAAPLGSGQCPSDTNLPHYVHVETPVGSRDGLNVIINSFPQWKQYLRPEASKSFLVITDDDATQAPNNSAATFSTNLTGLDPVLFAKWTMNSIYCFTQCPAAAAVGAVWRDLVAMTMGVGGDLCLQDFQPVFDRLANAVITGSGTKIECEWALAAPQTGQAYSPSLVAVTRTDSTGATPLMRVSSAAQCGPSGGWYFDSNLNPTKLVACPSSCMQVQNQMGGSIDIKFGCESVGACAAKDSTNLATGTCQWPLPSPPSGQALVLDTVNVRYTSASGFATDLGKVASAADCANVEEGWYFDNPTNPQQIVACPQTCAQVQAGGPAAKIEVLFGCKTADAPPVR